eukprot:4769814-Pleurochrysis_carterae.AAC.5
MCREQGRRGCLLPPPLARAGLQEVGRSESTGIMCQSPGAQAQAGSVPSRSASWPGRACSLPCGSTVQEAR